jgi:hypothetical protein
MMHRMKQWSTTSCPRCGEEETAEHVWTCQYPGANDLWEKAIEDLKTWCRREGTMPAIIEAVVNGLNGWRNNTDISQDRYYLEDKDVASAFHTQSQAGWKHFFEGRPSRQWAQIQTTYFRDSLRSQQTGKRWLIELIKKMWNIAWDLWEQRNGMVHDKETQVQNEALKQEVEQLWNTKERVRLPTRKGLPTSLEQLLRWPHDKQEHWRNLMVAQLRRLETTKMSSNFAAEREGIRRFLSQA